MPGLRIAAPGRMRRFAAAAALALALAGSASADVFRVVPTLAPSLPTFLPSAQIPNDAGLDRVPCRAPESTAGRRDAHLRPAARPLAASRRDLRRAVAGARGDQQGRVELRAQHGPELRRRDRLDAVHAVDVGALGRRRGRRRRSPTRGTPRTRSPRLPATSPPRAARTTSPARSSRTTTPSGTWTRCCSWPSCSARGGVDATFTLDRLQISLDNARRRVVARPTRSS